VVLRQGWICNLRHGQDLYLRVGVPVVLGGYESQSQGDRGERSAWPPFRYQRRS
jgi:hypothetical protein